MMNGNTAFRSASELAQLIRQKKLGCVELLDLYLGRVQKYNPQLNAVVAENFVHARQVAAQCDAELARGDSRGPLHGVPITIKESFDFPGLPTTWGLPEFKDNVASRPATAVARLERAGAIVFGKTNAAKNLADWQTFNAVYGTTNNPWDVRRSPGGSSGGSAAALAAGLTALEIGSDIGGSIRGPAHYCGIYGHRPTFGIVPHAGHALPGTYAPSDMLVAGPLARSAFDLELALTMIAGPDAQDGRGWRLTLPPAPPKPLSAFRIGMMLTSRSAEVDHSVTSKIEELAQWLRQQGAQVEERAPAIDHAQVHETYIMLLRGATSRGISPAVRETLLAALADTKGRSDYFTWQARGNTLTHAEWLEWNNIRYKQEKAWDVFFESFDLLLCPVAATTAVLHDQTGERWERMIPVNDSKQPSTTQMFWAGISAMVHLPSTVAPIGHSKDGLPVGVQIIGPKFADLSCISFAQILETRFTGYRAPSGFDAI